MENICNHVSRDTHTAQFLSLFLRVTAYVVRILSLVAERQKAAFGQQGRNIKVVPEEEITDTVRYLLTVQTNDGSFNDPNPVFHRDVEVSMYRYV